MKVLYLLRHAKSSWRDADLDDFDRPLNKRGRSAAKLIAQYMQLQKLRPDLVLCSAARRTRQTFDYISASLDGCPVLFEHDLYEAGMRELMERLHSLDASVASVLLIGHNPGMERLAGHLTDAKNVIDRDGYDRMRDKFPTGTLCILKAPIDDWTALRPACAHFAKFVRPVDLDGGAES